MLLYWSKLVTLWIEQIIISVKALNKKRIPNETSFVLYGSDAQAVIDHHQCHFDPTFKSNPKTNLNSKVKMQLMFYFLILPSWQWQVSIFIHQIGSNVSKQCFFWEIISNMSSLVSVQGRGEEAIDWLAVQAILDMNGQ